MAEEKQEKRDYGAWVWISVVVIIALGLAVGGYFWLRQERPEKYTGPVEKITVAAAEYLTGALVYVAEDQGFFEENGLEVTLKGYGSGKACADALIMEKLIFPPRPVLYLSAIVLSIQTLGYLELLLSTIVSAKSEPVSSLPE